MLITALVVAAAVGVATDRWVVGGEGAPVTFEVVDGPTGTVLHARPMSLGERFTLEHVHSVTRRPVRETFSVQAGPTVALEELWFDEPGPNLPSGPERIGDRTTRFVHEDGAFRVFHDGNDIGAVPLRVGRASVDHVVVFDGGDEVRLLDVAEQGSHVELRVTAQVGQGR